MKLHFLLLTLILTSFKISQAQQLPLYYGQDFLIQYQQNTLRDGELKQSLFRILSSGHLKNGSAPDTIIPNCNSATPEQSTQRCREHRPLGYDRARVKIFGSLYLETLSNGEYGVEDVYCEKLFTDDDFGGKPTFGPDMLPKSGNIINTEHTWPQSRFGGKFSREFQKSDLHHLFPTDSQMNSTRSSLRFGNVVRDREHLKCPHNRVGKDANGGEDVFEVPDSQKGNTARAIFYFATRYQMRISADEEAALREWDKQDPVDAEEYERNNQIDELQGNRNPYIDFADLIDRIDTFENFQQQ